jgi:hypothetical protein
VMQLYCLRSHKDAVVHVGVPALGQFDVGTR